MHDAFDADVLIYAASPTGVRGELVRAHLEALRAADATASGSVLLTHEVLVKPVRHEATDELRAISDLLAMLELHACDEAIVDRSIDLAAHYGLELVDAVHLATAIHVGAARFITNNRRDFSKDIAEIEIAYPEDLAA